MGLAALDNRTPFAAHILHSYDRQGRPRVIVLARAVFSWALSTRAAPGLALAAAQPPIELAGSHLGAAGASSLRHEPQLAYEKPGTDVAVVGHGHAPGGRATVVEASVCVGPVHKAVRLVGPRRWRLRDGGPVLGPPEPFERLPLGWELAHGGWDRRHPEPERHSVAADNPIGIGFMREDSRFEEGTPAPQIEDPREPLTHWGQQLRPAGLGLVPPHWEPRRRFAGTYDAAWRTERMPALPHDFDLRFFSAAAADMLAVPHLTGSEPVVLENLTPEGHTTFALPGLCPRCEVHLDFPRLERHEPPLRLDTVLIDTDTTEIFLTWRASLPLTRGALDLRGVRLRLDAPRPATSGGPR